MPQRIVPRFFQSCIGGHFGILATGVDNLTIRHVKDLAMSNIEIVPQNRDMRPAFVLNEVQGCDFFRIKTRHVEDIPTFVLDNVSDFSVARARPVPDTQLDHVDHKNL